MSFSYNKDINKNLSEENQKMIHGGCASGMPIHENEISVYKDGDIWVAGIMRERGNIFEIGRFVDKTMAICSANEYAKHFLQNWIWKEIRFDVS